MSKEKFDELLQGYINNRLTEAELSQFIQLLRQGRYQRELHDSINLLFASDTKDAAADVSKANAVFQNIMLAAKSTSGEQGEIVRPPYKRIGGFFKWAAAACLIGLFGTGGYFLLRQKTIYTSETVLTSRYKNDVEPGGNKALLTLADGRQISLNNSSNNAIASQDGISINEQNGTLVYKAVAKDTGELQFHDLTTPRGGQYKLYLADGSLVWLNAGSSLRFSPNFSGKERKVELKGEAYFEVAKNKQKPFIVSANGAEVQVLGTHFSVSAYPDEASVKTTLLEGSVKIVSGKSKKILHPGQQSVIVKAGEVKLIDSASTIEAVAWTNGAFVFEGADIETIMRQLARWYDVGVVYNRKTTDLFYAEIPRSTKLSDALKALELTGKIRFGIEGRKIIVGP